jgi:hypothetical protein
MLFRTSRSDGSRGMPTVDPEMLAGAVGVVFQSIGLKLTARAIPSLKFQQWVEHEDGTRGSAVVEAPAVQIGNKIAIRVEKDYYRVYNLASSPYHGLFHQGVCKTKSTRIAIRVAVMAAVHELFSDLFEEHVVGLPDD